MWRVRLRHIGLLTLSTLAACYESHAVTGDGDPADAHSDGGLNDVGHPDGDDAASDSGTDADTGPMMCEDIGRHRPCSWLCDQPCPEGHFCHFESGVCQPFNDPFPARQGNFCWFVDVSSFRGRAVAYCDDDTFCAPKQGFNPRVAGERSGICRDLEYCRRAEEIGARVRCIYSDFTPFVDGPEIVSECPASPSALVPFCGLPCGAERCPATESRPTWGVACAGVNEERDIGICTIGNQACPVPPTSDGGDLARLEDAVGETLACAVFREQSPSPMPYGWVTSLEVCREYKRRFPSALDCYDRDQNPALP